MAKLSKAQERELNRIKSRYSIELVDGLAYWEKQLQEAPEQHKHWIAEEVELANKGFINWYSANSRTLEKLAEYGYIEYLKDDCRARTTPIDHIRLL